MPLRLVNSLFMTSIDYLIWRRGYQPARYFFLAKLMTTLSYIPFGLIRLGLVPSFSLAEQGHSLGIILAGLFFSFATGGPNRSPQERKRRGSTQFSGCFTEYGTDDEGTEYSVIAECQGANPGFTTGNL